MTAGFLTNCATRDSLMAQRVKNLPVIQEMQVQSLGWEDPWRRKWQLTPVFLLENPKDRGAWWATVHGVTDTRTNMFFTFTFSPS